MFFVRSKGSLLFNIVYVVSAIALGIFIINHPEALISTVIRIVGICSLAVGVYTLLRYFLRGRSLGETPLNILIGGVMTVAGLIFLFYPLKLTAIVFIIIGAVILSKGICELRVAWEARRVGFIGWNGMMVSAVITTLLGILMLVNPLFAPSIIFYVMGGALIFEGVATAVAYFVSRDYNDVNSN